MSRPTVFRRLAALGARRGAPLRPWLYALAWLLLFTQTLGLVHSVLHAPGSPAPAQTITATATAADSAEAKDWSTLFGHNAGAACHLYDQLTHGDTFAAASPAALPQAAPVFVAALAATPPRAADAAPFLARGPPSFG